MIFGQEYDDVLDVPDDVSENVLDPVSGSAEGGTVGLLGLIRAKPKATYKELSAELGVTTRTVQRHILKLKDAGKLNRIGSERNGYWEITW